jgi:hypothetical protein
MERDRLNDPVTLVEDPEHGDALRHRGHAAFAIGGRSDLAARGHGRILSLSALTARRERQRD